jgi:hypothetical protein
MAQLSVGICRNLFLEFVHLFSSVGYKLVIKNNVI